MSLISNKFGVLWVVTSIVVMTVAPGCSYSEADLCDDVCACEGCSDAEYDDCIDTAEDDAKRADEEGCSDQRGEYLDCADEEFDCRDHEVDLDGCEAEFGRLLKCVL